MQTSPCHFFLKSSWHHIVTSARTGVLDALIHTSQGSHGREIKKCTTLRRKTTPLLKLRGVPLRPRAECAVGDGCERAGRVFLGQGGFYRSFATAAETLAQLCKCLALENKNEEQVDAVQGVQHAGESIQSIVARDPRDELKHPDDAHDD